MASRAAGKRQEDKEQGGRRKLVEFDEETWAALDVLARDRLSSFQELADEAFRDLLRKHHRPVGLRKQPDQLLQQLLNMDAPGALRGRCTGPARATIRFADLLSFHTQ